MPSKFFAKVGLSDEALKQDIKLLASLNTAQSSEISKMAIGLQAAEDQTNYFVSSVRESDILSKLGVEKVRSCLSVTAFLVKGILENRDSVEDIVDDIAKEIQIDLTQRESLLKYLDHYKREYESSSRKVVIERAAVRSTLPWWKSISASIDFRAVFENTYQTEDPIEEYKPSLIRFSPLCIVFISVEDTEDEVKSVCFQADEKSLDRLISCLTAAKKELSIARKSFQKG